MINNALFAILFLSLLFLSLFFLYLLFWLIVSFFYRDDRTTKKSSTLNKFVIVIPAHNEELMIGQLIDSTLEINYPKERYNVIVIADNCTDNTERIVREKRVDCFVRTNTNKRGKPYALNWIFKQIDINKYDAFVLIDADSKVDKKFLTVMNQSLNQGHQVIQGYFGILNPDETWLTRLMVIPGVLKYLYRYHGKNLLGFTCPLMGNGMCFSKQVIMQYGWDAFTLTENWEYYIRLVLRGYKPAYADAHIYSQTAATTRQGATQRKRWFKGKIQCVISYLPKLIVRGIMEKNLRYIDCAVELVMPSISMLINFTVIILVISLIEIAFLSNCVAIFIWALILSVFFVAYFLFGIVANRSPLNTWLALFKAPFFLAWKLITTLYALIKIKNTDWVKTQRK